jgi:hypothetical protein
MHQLQLIFTIICAQQNAFKPAYLDGLKLCNHFNHQLEATHRSSWAMSSHSSTLSPSAQTFAPQSAKDFWNVFKSRIYKLISNACYGTASFFITAIGPLQKHFQCRLWRYKFPHYGDRTIAKTLVWLLSCSSPMALQVRKPLEVCSCCFGNAARMGHVAAYKAWEPI